MFRKALGASLQSLFPDEAEVEYSRISLALVDSSESNRTKMVHYTIKSNQNLLCKTKSTYIGISFM